MNKRVFLLTIALVVIVFGTTFAEISRESALELAKKYVPEDAQYLIVKDSGDEYEVKFYRGTDNCYYKVEVDKEQSRVEEVTRKHADDIGSFNVKINEEQAQATILKEYPTAQILSVNLERDDGYNKYEVKFILEGNRGEAEVNPSTGYIIKATIKY